MTSGRLRLAAGVLVLAGAGCSSDDQDGAIELPLVGEIAPAVDALESELGGAQEYFEINATPLLVTLWVASDDGTEVVPYAYADGELSDAQAAQAATGVTFTADEALAFDSDTVLDQVVEDLGESTIAQFSIVGGPGSDVALTVVVDSDRGGRIGVRVTPTGDVIEAAEIEAEEIDGSEVDDPPAG